jgi:hypothetical protein
MNTSAKSATTAADKKAIRLRFVKTNIPNLVKLDPLDTYIG